MSAALPTPPPETLPDAPMSIPSASSPARASTPSSAAPVPMDTSPTGPASVTSPTTSATAPPKPQPDRASSPPSDEVSIKRYSQSMHDFILAGWREANEALKRKAEADGLTLEAAKRDAEGKVHAAGPARVA